MISGQGIHTLSLGKVYTMISGRGIHTLSLGKVYTMISGQVIHTLSLGKVHTNEIWARHTHTKSRQGIHNDI